MKHFIQYDEFLNEKNLFAWLVKSRKISDLVSLRTVNKLATLIAELDYKYNTRLREFQDANIANGKSPNAISFSDTDELSGYTEKKNALLKRFNLKYGDSDFLNYVKDLTIADEEVKYADRKLRNAKSKPDKQLIMQTTSLANQEVDILKRQIELSQDEPTVAISALEQTNASRERKRLDDELNNIRNAKARLELQALKTKMEQGQSNANNSNAQNINKSKAKESSQQQSGPAKPSINDLDV